MAIKGSDLALEISPELAKAMLGTLKPKRGDCRWPKLPGFVLRVLPTPIQDQKGKVTEVLGLR